MKRTRLVRHVLADCYCRLRPSPIHGIGVYAIRDIPKGKNPFKTLPKYARPGYVRVTDDELDALPPNLSGMIRALFVPTDGSMYVPTCGTNVVYLLAYLNHSAAPNLRTTDGFNFFARRKIREGEELTVNYRTYGADALPLQAT
jgi:SET domain-containing protein